jgi:DNA-binding ferritin-like protein
MDKCEKTAALYLASLRTMALIHQQNHWLTKGDSFYGSHLLFERIYDSAQENVDGAAEKLIGLFDIDCDVFCLTTDMMTTLLKKYQEMCKSSPLAASLRVEQEFLKLSQEAYDCFKEHDKMTQGLDDFMLATASDREEAIYLLKQALKK